MGRHLLIAVSRHSKRDVFLCCLSVLWMSYNLVGPCSPKVSKPKMGNLENHFCVYWRRLCALSSYFTLVCLRITLVRETPTEISSLPLFLPLDVSSFGIGIIHCKSQKWIHFYFKSLLLIASLWYNYWNSCLTVKWWLLCFFTSIFLNVLLNWHENVFLLKCTFNHIFAYANLSTLFVLTPCVSILNKYRLGDF